MSCLSKSELAALERELNNHDSEVLGRLREFFLKHDIFPPDFEELCNKLGVTDRHQQLGILIAYMIAFCGHDGQERRDKSKYITHPLGALLIYAETAGVGRLDVALIILILIHDVVEDTKVTLQMISACLGEECSLDLSSLSKEHGQKGDDYLIAYLLGIIARGPSVILVKLCDRAHNLETLQPFTEVKRKEKILETQTFHMLMLLPALRSYGGDYIRMANELEQRMNRAIAQYQ